MDTVNVLDASDGAVMNVCVRAMTPRTAFSNAGSIASGKSTVLAGDVGAAYSQYP